MSRKEEKFDVVPLAPIPGSKKYTYKADATLNLTQGSLVRVPFGKRFIQGIVWSKTTKFVPGIKPIEKVEINGIISKEEILWLEELSQLTLEPLSLLAKSLVSIRKPFKNLLPLKEPTSRTRGKIRFHWTSEVLDTIGKNKGQTLILIPETSLQSEVVRKISVSESKIFFFNQKLKVTERRKIVESVLTNDNCVVVSTHGGIFLPFNNLTNVVVYEPAIESHRQWDMHPHYDARTAVFVKNKFASFDLDYVSSLPYFDLFAFSKKVKTSGKFNKFLVEATEKNFDEWTIFSKQTEEKIKEIVEKNGKVLIFNDSIGNESRYKCMTCGKMLRCSVCGGVLEKISNRLKCGLCGQDGGPVRSFCLFCGSPKLRPLKIGTKAIEAHVKSIFPNKKIGRVDRHSPLFTSESNYDVIVGTQKIFSNLTEVKFDLAVVLDFDKMISEDNFDSLQNMMVKLARIAKAANLVLLETTNVKKRIVKLLVEGEVMDLVNEDLAARKALRLPPYASVDTLSKVFDSEQNAKKQIREIVRKLTNNGLSDVGWKVFPSRRGFVGEIFIHGENNKISSITPVVGKNWTDDVYVPLMVLL